jgi:hypothetical protein
MDIEQKKLIPTIQVSLTLQSLSVVLGAVRCGAMRFGSVRYGTVRYGTVRYGTVRYGTVRYGTVRYGTVRYWYLVGTCCGSRSTGFFYLRTPIRKSLQIFCGNAQLSVFNVKFEMMFSGIVFLAQPLVLLFVFFLSFPVFPPFFSNFLSLFYLSSHSLSFLYFSIFPLAALSFSHFLSLFYLSSFPSMLKFSHAVFVSFIVWLGFLISPSSLPLSVFLVFYVEELIFTHSSFIHSFIHSFILSLYYSITYSFSHSFFWCRSTRRSRRSMRSCSSGRAT